MPEQGGRRRLAKRHRRPHLGFEGIDLQLNRLLINEKHGCSKREQGRLYRMYIREYTRVLQRCTQGLGACSQLINGWAESQPVKLEGVSFVLAPINLDFVCVCVHEGWTKIGRSRLPVRNNLEAINCGSNILEEAGSSNRISESRV